MRAAIALGYIIGEAQNRLVIAVIPPQRQFDADIVLSDCSVTGTSISADLFLSR